MNTTNYSYNTEENFHDFTEEARTEVILYGILFLVALCGNLPVFISLIWSRRRISRIEELLLHLIIGDLIVTCVVMPLEICWRITVEWIAGNTFCRIMLFVRAFGPYLSSMVAACIAIDRFTSIVYPLKVNVANKRVRCMLCCAWASSFLCSLPQAFTSCVQRPPMSFYSLKKEYEKVIYNLFCLFVLYFGPLIAIIYCYFGLLWVIWKRSNPTQRANEDTISETSTESIFRLSDTPQLKKTLHRTLKMTFLIVISFFACWTPYVVIDLWYLFDAKSAENLDTRVQSLMFASAAFNSCINPLVYGCFTFDPMASLKKLCHCQSLQLRSDRSGPDIRRKVTSEDRMDKENVENQSPHQVEVFLELREATPVRRALGHRNVMDVTIL